jgi:hypothetical protein
MYVYIQRSMIAWEEAGSEGGKIDSIGSPVLTLPNLPKG